MNRKNGCPIFRRLKACRSMWRKSSNVSSHPSTTRATPRAEAIQWSTRLGELTTSSFLYCFTEKVSYVKVGYSFTKTMEARDENKKNNLTHHHDVRGGLGGL